jgi:hypothetical protein
MKMKKLFYSAILFATVFTLNSCGEEDPAQAISVDETFTNRATIEGYVYLNTNKSSTETVTYAPEGTILSFVIAYEDLGVVDSDGNYVKTTTVSAEGTYSIDLPAKADGTPVPVNIQGAQVHFTVTSDDGKEKEQLFETLPATQYIIGGLVYQKKIEYTESDALRETENWTEGTYKATLKYYDGKEEKFVPVDTDVKITITKDQFVPERTNDLIFIAKTGANGSLEIKQPAPSLLNGGLDLTLESAFIAEYVTDVVTNTASSYKYSLTASATIYGGETVNKGTIPYQRGDKVSANTEKSWTNGTYTVKLAYKTGAYDDNNDPVIKAVPTGTSLEVRVPDYYSTTTEPYKFVTTVGSGGLVTIELKAPPATEAPLTFSINDVNPKVSFVAKFVTGYDAGEEIYNDFVFTIPAIPGYIYGEGRNVDGGTVEATKGTQLTFKLT